MSAPTTYVCDERLASLAASGQEFVHLITIATKPDIIKQAPVHQALLARGEQVLLCHTGQHYDDNYSGAMLGEFGLEVDVHLAIDGSMSTKVAQIIERFGAVLDQLAESGLTAVPYIHGDTMTSMAVGVSSYLRRVACVHVEAGIRTLTPRAEVYRTFLDQHRDGALDWSAYRSAMTDPATYERGSQEPFPEQFNTRVSDAASGFHAAPVELVRGFLLDEGYPPSTVQVVGNSVVDATVTARREAAQATVFDRYPQLRGGGFVRFCIHRRENTESEHRFGVLFDAMEQLVRGGQPVLLISLFGTEQAIDRWGLRERLQALVADHPQDFVYSQVWPFYRDVIAAMLECAAVATDSGSMQEEMNILGVPCVTLRFGTDRGESLLAGGNVLAPPVDGSFVASIVRSAVADPGLRDVRNIYGAESSALLVDAVLARLRPGWGVFLSEEARLGLEPVTPPTR